MPRLGDYLNGTSNGSRSVSTAEQTAHKSRDDKLLAFILSKTERFSQLFEKARHERHDGWLRLNIKFEGGDPAKLQIVYDEQYDLEKELDKAR